MKSYFLVLILSLMMTGCLSEDVENWWVNSSENTTRKSTFIIQDGSNADTIISELLSGLDGYSIPSTDNIAKSTTIGDFSLNISGRALHVSLGDVDEILSINAWAGEYPDGFWYDVACVASATGGDIILHFPYDLTAVVDPVQIPQIDGAVIWVEIAYITS